MATLSCYPTLLCKAKLQAHFWQNLYNEKAWKNSHVPYFSDLKLGLFFLLFFCRKFFTESTFYFRDRVGF